MSSVGSGYAIGVPRRFVPALEAVTPIFLAQAYIWSVPHGRPRWWDVVCGGLITAFLVLTIVRNGPRDRRAFGLGLRADHWRAAGPLLLMTCACILVVLAYGWMTDILRRDWDILAAMAAYPVWGFVQQGVMLAFAYPRLKTALGPRWAPLATAALFGLAHTPNLPLMLGGVVMVLGYVFIWERAPSLPLTGLSHGLIGAVCDKALHISMRVGAHYFG